MNTSVINTLESPHLEKEVEEENILLDDFGDYPAALSVETDKLNAALGLHFCMGNIVIWRFNRNKMVKDNRMGNASNYPNS